MCRVLNKYIVLLVLLVLVSSCSKESMNDADEETNVVSWNDTRYDVCYASCMDPARSAPTNDMYFGVNLALENSENPSKELSLSCVNYVYGEKVDLTTQKYNSRITFKDGQKNYYFDGGDSDIQPGSYYVLTRKGDRISVTIHLISREYNGFIRNLDVNYEGSLTSNDYLPEEDWQNKPRHRYNYIHDDVSYDYSTWASIHVDEGVASFNCSVFVKDNVEVPWGQFAITVKNLDFGQKIDLTSRDHFLWSSLVAFENILPGSYMYVVEGKYQYEVTIDLFYKDSNGESHHLLIEYNVYK